MLTTRYWLRDILRGPRNFRSKRERQSYYATLFAEIVGLVFVPGYFNFSPFERTLAVVVAVVLMTALWEVWVRWGRKKFPLRDQ